MEDHPPSDDSSPASTRHRLAQAHAEAHAFWKPVPDNNLCKVIEAYDGDTVTVLISIRGEIYKFHVRMLGIDCPEIRGRGDTEKAAAIAVRDVVRHVCIGRICGIEAHGTDKYGRLLGRINLDNGHSICEFLLSHRLGKAYDGGTRQSFSTEELTHIIKNAQALIT